MLQFYFMSVFLNALIGCIFFFGENSVVEFKSVLHKNETFMLILGILSALTGLLKMLSPIEGDLLIIGDIVPALMGFLCGFIIVFEFFSKNSSLEDTEQKETINKLFIVNKKIIGVAAIVIAVLHFLFPKVLLL